MKYLILLSCVFIISCKGSLTDEQRKRIKESMEQGEIKKLTDSEITQAAYQYGREIVKAVELKDIMLTNPILLDSISKNYHVEIIALQATNNNLRAVEKQILEAYSIGGGAIENVQRMGADSLLYSKPILREHPDGSSEFLKAIGIRMTRKQVVLSIK